MSNKHGRGEGDIAWILTGQWRPLPGLGQVVNDVKSLAQLGAVITSARGCIRNVFMGIIAKVTWAPWVPSLQATQGSAPSLAACAVARSLTPCTTLDMPAPPAPSRSGVCSRQHYQPGAG
mgnify:CR=1 FL=1